MKRVIKKVFVFLLTLIFSSFVLYQRPAYSLSNRTIGFCLLGVSLLTGGGSFYLRKNAIKKYNEAETLHEEYKAIPDGRPNVDYEKAHEKYEDKYGEAKQMRTYYLICMGASVLSFAGAIVFLLKKSSPNKIINFGYNVNYQKGYNDLYLKVRF